MTQLYINYFNHWNEIESRFFHLNSVQSWWVSHIHCSNHVSNSSRHHSATSCRAICVTVWTKTLVTQSLYPVNQRVQTETDFRKTIQDSEGEDGDERHILWANRICCLNDRLHKWKAEHSKWTVSLNVSASVFNAMSSCFLLWQTGVMICVFKN